MISQRYSRRRLSDGQWMGGVDGMPMTTILGVPFELKVVASFNLFFINTGLAKTITTWLYVNIFDYFKHYTCTTLRLFRHQIFNL